MNIGSKGLIELNLIIPQGTSFDFILEHLDEKGRPVNHTSSRIEMCLIDKSSNDKKIDLSEYAKGIGMGIKVEIPYQATAKIPIGIYNWNMLVYSGSENCSSFAYGKTRIINIF